MSMAVRPSLSDRGEAAATGVNRVQLGNEELVNLTQDTVEPGAVVSGFTFHGSDGDLKEGTLGEATQQTAGLMSAADKTKLDGMPESIVMSGTKDFWNRQTSYIPDKGVILIYEDYMVDSNGKNVPAFKIADGLAYAVDLPFATIGGIEEVKAHIGNTNIHVTQVDKEFWNNKWRGYINLSDPCNLVFTVN